MLKTDVNNNNIYIYIYECIAGEIKIQENLKFS